MTKYRVIFVDVQYIDVEASDPDAAIEGMYAAPESDYVFHERQPIAVDDEDGKQVWTDERIFGGPEGKS